MIIIIVSVQVFYMNIQSVPNLIPGRDALRVKVASELTTL